jgi:hypothetical protein
MTVAPETRVRKLSRGKPAYPYLSYADLYG